MQFAWRGKRRCDCATKANSNAVTETHACTSKTNLSLAMRLRWRYAFIITFADVRRLYKQSEEEPHHDDDYT